jgi:hypothetical protein
VAASIIAGLAAIPATARPAPGPPVPDRFSSDDNCLLSRVGIQYVKCDNLTGGGVQAPLWVPGLFPQSPQGDG